MCLLALVLAGCGSRTSRPADPAPQPIANIAPDAAVPDAAPPAPPPDAAVAESGPSRDEIIALSKFGFLTVDAKPKAIVYIDEMRVGETPVTRMPLKPGPHTLKLNAKGKKPYLKEITILGASDTDLGTVTW